MYEYEPRPRCPTCGGSRYLFCARSQRCVSKIRVGGNCQGFVSGEDACYNGRCVNGRCVGGAAPTTARPITVPHVRRPAIIQNCFNENECCSVWAQIGQCQANPGYMALWCKVSCGRCRPSYALSECDNRHPKCIPWSRSGECSRNPWMLENCRLACGRCGTPRQAVCWGGNMAGMAFDMRPPMATPRHSAAARPVARPATRRRAPSRRFG